MEKRMTIEEHAKDLWNDLEHALNDESNEAKIICIQAKLEEVRREQAAVNRGVDDLFTLITNGVASALLDKVELRTAIQTGAKVERQHCLQIAEEIRKRELANYTGANYPAHTIAEEIRDKINARGEKKEESRSTT